MYICIKNPPNPIKCKEMVYLGFHLIFKVHQQPAPSPIGCNNICDMYKDAWAKVATSPPAKLIMACLKFPCQYGVIPTSHTPFRTFKSI